MGEHRIVLIQSVYKPREAKMSSGNDGYDLTRPEIKGSEKEGKEKREAENKEDGVRGGEAEMVEGEEECSYCGEDKLYGDCVNPQCPESPEYDDELNDIDFDDDVDKDA